MGVHLEDGLYIVVNSLLPCIEEKQSAHIRRSVNEVIRNSGARAVRFRVKGGVSSWLGHDFLTYYQRNHHDEYRKYSIISHVDQLTQGLLPYPERS